MWRIQKSGKAARQKRINSMHINYCHIISHHIISFDKLKRISSAQQHSDDGHHGQTAVSQLGWELLFACLWISNWSKKAKAKVALAVVARLSTNLHCHKYVILNLKPSEALWNQERLCKVYISCTICTLQTWCWLVDEELISSKECHNLGPSLPRHLSTEHNHTRPQWITRTTAATLWVIYLQCGDITVIYNII